MLVLRILSTIFISLSYMTGFIKNCALFEYKSGNTAKVMFWTVYGVLWRTLVIVTIWLI